MKLKQVGLMAVALFCTSGLAGAQDLKDYSEWNAWKDFGVGSSVTYQIMKNASMEMSYRYTVEKKEDDKITLKVEQKMIMGGKGDWKPAAGQNPKIIKKPASATAHLDKECKQCGKKYKDHDMPKAVEKKVKVAGTEVTARSFQLTDCKTGKNTMLLTFCNKIPGWMINLGGPKRPVTAFTAK